VSYQPSVPGQNTYYLRARCDSSFGFQFEVNLDATTDVTEAQLDTAFQSLVTAINGSSAWTVDYAEKSNVDDQQVTP
jgi:hypothetical protein